MEIRQNSLSSKGLSMSQAQTISNLCNQKCVDIDNKIDTINNYSKSLIQKDNSGSYSDDKSYCISKAVKMPDNIVDLLIEKCQYHACQAFLLENIKAKEALLNHVKKSNPDLSNLALPERPTLNKYIDEPMYDESYGWNQLTASEINEYLEAEAFASHIGKFIHAKGKLSELRNELSTIPDIEWITINNNEKSMVRNTIHHTPENLMNLHENLANMHKTYEQKVNYYKSKVKNLTTDKNTEIAKHNADENNRIDLSNKEMLLKYESDMNQYNQEVSRIKKEFEIQRQKKIKEYSVYRIDVPAQFQPVIDKLKPVEE